MRVIDRPFSDLLRHPKEVTSDLDDGDVLLRRRGEPDVLLSRADRDDERAASLVGLGRALRHLAVHQPKALAEALDEAFPWLTFLPRRDRDVFIREFSVIVAGAVELDNLTPVSQLLREWRATAEVHADPKLARRLRRPLTAGGGPVVPVAD